MIGDYISAIHAEALSRTKGRFAETWQGWTLVALGFLIGVYFHARYKDWSTALDDGVVTVLSGLATTVCVPLLYYVVMWLSAPYRLWDFDQKRLARQTLAAGHRDIADQLKSHCIKGQQLLQSWTGTTFNNDVRIWQKTAEALVEKCGREELAMFQTLYPPLVRAALYTHSYRRRDKSRLKGMIEKLRYIMARQYQADATFLEKET